MSMFYFYFEVRPRPKHAKSKEYGGAAACCWIKRDDQNTAENVARRIIVEQNWVITKLEGAGLITRETQNLEGMEYFKQAEIDGEVVVFHVWPIGALDDKENI